MLATSKRPPGSPRSENTHFDEEILFHEMKKVSRSNLSSLDPPPETKRALLTCYDCNTITNHTFLGRRQVSDGSGSPLYLELVYTCPCGKTRVWGTEDAVCDTE